jgi:hypothetical protein
MTVVLGLDLPKDIERGNIQEVDLSNNPLKIPADSQQ